MTIQADTCSPPMISKSVIGAKFETVHADSVYRTLYDHIGKSLCTTDEPVLRCFHRERRQIKSGDGKEILAEIRGHFWLDLSTTRRP